MVDTILAKQLMVTLVGSVAGNSAAAWIDTGGGNLRLKGKKAVRWVNQTGRAIRLRFTELPDDMDTSAADPVWSFAQLDLTGGAMPDALGGVVSVPVGGFFEGKVTGTGRVIIKYSVEVMAPNGSEVDGTIRKLDPLIIVDR
jgi:hypothetical protein